ncbi:MAG: hypothetical protein M0Z54_03655 [Thermaerobacter sp.]|nr:hypothetical protein [Thermaerobacter sp.]
MAVLGDRARMIPISSTAVTTALALRDGFLPPTTPNHPLPTESVGTDFVQKPGRHADWRCAFSHSFALGGHTACLALGRANTG